MGGQDERMWGGMRHHIWCPFVNLYAPATAVSGCSWSVVHYRWFCGNVMLPCGLFNFLNTIIYILWPGILRTPILALTLHPTMSWTLSSLFCFGLCYWTLELHIVWIVVIKDRHNSRLDDLPDYGIKEDVWLLRGRIQSQHVRAKAYFFLCFNKKHPWRD